MLLHTITTTLLPSGALTRLIIGSSIAGVKDVKLVKLTTSPVNKLWGDVVVHNPFIVWVTDAWSLSISKIKGVNGVPKNILNVLIWVIGVRKLNIPYSTPGGQGIRLIWLPSTSGLNWKWYLHPSWAI